MKRAPQRSCDCCRITKDKNSLLRLVCDDDGQWWPDLRQKAPGRGKYLCLEPECLHRLNERQVQRIFDGGMRQLLLGRIHDAIEQRLQELMHRLRGRSILGKEAVLQLLWQKSPLVVMVADDASSGLWDRVGQAVDKHCRQQKATRLFRIGTMAWFGEIYDRDRIAVLAWNRDALTDKLVVLMGWRQLMVDVG